MKKSYNEELAMCDNSEVFHEFLKLTKAYDNGLEDSKPVEVGQSDNKKDKDIENLFGPATPDQDKNGKELIEDAHETVEILNSYLHDAGEFKNSYDAQQAAIHTVMKQPRMYNTRHKDVCAVNDLLNELVVVAEEMSIRGHNDLCSFADDMICRIHDTNESVKKKLKIKEANRWKATSALSGNAGTFFKWMFGLLGAGALVYTLTKRIDNSKVYSIRVACQSFIKSITDYKESHRDTLDDESRTALDAVVKTVSEYEVQYYNRSDNFKMLYEQIVDFISGPKTNSVNVDDAYNKLVKLNAEVDQLSVKMQRPLQDAISNVQTVQQDMENQGNVSGARTNWDAFKENAQISYRAISGTDEQLLVDNFNKLISSIDADKAKRSRRLSNLKSMIDTYKHNDSVEERQQQNSNNLQTTNDVRGLVNNINQGKQEQNKAELSPFVVSEQ